jgi:hypothetical protein
VEKNLGKQKEKATEEAKKKEEQLYPDYVSYTPTEITETKDIEKNEDPDWLKQFIKKKMPNKKPSKEEEAIRQMPPQRKRPTYPGPPSALVAQLGPFPVNGSFEARRQWDKKFSELDQKARREFEEEQRIRYTPLSLKDF